MSENQSSLAHYLSVVRRQLWLILLLPAVALASAGVVVLLQDTVYRASSKIVVGQGGGVFQAQFGNAVDPFSSTMRNLVSSDKPTEIFQQGNVIRGSGVESDPALTNIRIRGGSAVIRSEPRLGPEPRQPAEADTAGAAAP